MENSFGYNQKKNTMEKSRDDNFIRLFHARGRLPPNSYSHTPQSQLMSTRRLLMESAKSN